MKKYKQDVLFSFTKSISIFFQFILHSILFISLLVQFVSLTDMIMDDWQGSFNECGLLIFLYYEEVKTKWEEEEHKPLMN